MAPPPVRINSLHSLHALQPESGSESEDDRPSLGKAGEGDAHKPLTSSSEAPLLDYDSRTTLPKRARASYLRFRQRRPLLMAAIQFAVLFAVSFFGLVLLLKVLLPPLDDEHGDKVKIPKNFEQLKDLNTVLHVYTERNPVRVLASFCAVYLMLQAYSLPGSMYMSILGGSMYGYANIPLCCTLVATGATLCYFTSVALGPALLAASEKWQRRVDTWTNRIQAQGSNLFSYLVILRIAPLPPHNWVNLLSPHLGIGVPLFWTSTWVGIFGQTTIHTTIGKALDDMTSPSDFHLISFKNAFGLGVIIAAVSVPLVLRRVYATEVANAAEPDDLPPIALPVDAAEALHPERTIQQTLHEARLVFLHEDGRVDERRDACRRV